MRLRARVLKLAALGLVAACSKEPTQIIVVVDSDLAVPSELPVVRAVVRWAGEDVVADERFELLGGRLTDSRSTLPLSFGIGPGQDPSGEVTVELHALRPGEGLHFVRRAITRFRPNQTLLLPMFLARACVAEDCGAGQTCTENGCRPELIDPNTLQVVKPGTELEVPIGPDGGARPDAGGPVDGGGPQDAGAPRDAAPDAEAGVDADAPEDAGPSPDAGDAGVVEPCGPEVADGERCGPGELRCCAGACVDTDSTTEACGAGCAACGVNARCQGGQCECLEPFDNCDQEPGCEADLSSDHLHCSGCFRPCQDGTSCIDRTCRACVEAGDCPRDNLSCTGDPVCSLGVCEQPLLSGWCLIGGLCVSDGTPRDGNPCEVCNAQAPFAWSVNAEAVCDDGQYCTAVDRCDTAGQCVGSGSPCPVGPSCVQSECTETTGCSVRVQMGFCAIGNACVTAGTRNPNNSCQICDPMQNDRGWTVTAGASCNDGLFCTVTDICNPDGVCVGSGSPCVNRQCGNEVCVESQDRCEIQLNDGWCFINSACVPAGAQDPGNNCRACQPVVNRFSYTPVPDGSSCGIANVCCGGNCILAMDGLCPAPACNPPCLVGSECQCDPGGGCTCCPIGSTCI